MTIYKRYALPMTLMMFLAILLIGCRGTGEPSEKTNDDTTLMSDTMITENLLNKEGMTVAERYLTPPGYTRIEVEEDSFGAFLRQRPLKPYGEKVLYYNGREKSAEGIYDSVLDVDIGDRDLHQCADAVMLLRAEYLYAQKRCDEISFNFVSGFTAEYSRWMAGDRIRVEGNDVSYYNATGPSDTYESFRKYMDMVFAYASTLSLDKQLVPVNVEDMMIGDVFIVGGSPGHAVIVMDMAINEHGSKIFILAQSYMPAQQTQILINAGEPGMSPWYSLADEDLLKTPEWTFSLDRLKRF
jgi:hypothetical protein